MTKANGRVVIEDAEGWSIGDQGSSPHAAQAAAMKVLGEDITYTELLGTSGLAFRLQVEKNLCSSSPHSFCGKQCVEGSVKALPWKIEIFQAKEDDVDGVRKAREAIVASIDRGIPVQYGSEEDGLIVGYQKGGEEWIAFHALRGNETIIEASWPWGIAVFSERKTEQADRRELALASLKLAVEMASAEDVENYTLGRRAWDTWLAKLKELESADEKACGEVIMGNSWIYGTLAEYRLHASKYLRSVANLFEGGVSAHLLTAANTYEEMATKVLVDEQNCVLDIAPPPWHLKEGQKWDNAWRARQIARLQKARPLEEKALEEIGLALASLE